MNVFLIRHKPTGQYRTKASYPKLAAPGKLGRVYTERGHAQAIITQGANYFEAEQRYRREHPEWYKGRGEDKSQIYNPELWEIVEFKLNEVPPTLKPGDSGVSPSGIPFTVRADGSRSFVGYGGAFD